MGILAGRFKRRWVLERNKKDAERATELYSQAMALSEKADDPDQVYYHAINVAFMALAAESDKKKAGELARKALAHCAKAEDNLWRSATEGEANLYLGNDQEAVAGYQAALDKNPAPRQITSMFQQAIRVAEIQGKEALAERLRAVFRDNES